MGKGSDVKCKTLGYERVPENPIKFLVRTNLNDVQEIKILVDDENRVFWQREPVIGQPLAGAHAAVIPVGRSKASPQTAADNTNLRTNSEPMKAERALPVPSRIPVKAETALPVPSRIPNQRANAEPLIKGNKGPRDISTEVPQRQRGKSQPLPSSRQASGPSMP